MELRYYQQQAIDAIYHFLRTKDGNPCVVLPTAAGKTPLLATICKDAVSRWNGRVLVLAHVKELLQQAADKLQAICPEIEVGIYSAGLNSRDTDTPIIVAGIQSVYRKACELDRFDLIIVDEAHMIPPPRHPSNGVKRPTGANPGNGAVAPSGRPPSDPPDGEGMYQTFLKDAKIVNPQVRLIGLTATPFRMKSGTLIGPDNLLNEICYEIGVKELIEQGFLCPLKTRAGNRKVDCSNLHIRAGEFVASEVEELMDTQDNVDAACREIVSQTRDRNSVLIFGVSVAHATHIKETIERMTSRECGLIIGDTPSSERELILRRFKGEIFAKDLFGTESEPLKYLVNVNVLTTGFDAPNVDCVVLLRPTASAGLYYQMTGRGFRLHESKADCLVLDYGNNIIRHGPVDAIEVKDRKRKSSGAAPVKECPSCHLIVHAAISACPECQYEFPKPEKERHEAMASNEGIISDEIIDTEYEVERIYYSVHSKRGASDDDPKTLRIDYEIAMNDVKSEWVCPEHTGWARKRFEKWWCERSNDPVPDTAELAVRIGRAGGIAEAKTITVRKVAGERYDRIIKHDLNEKPYPVSDYLDDDHDEVYLDEDEIPF